MDIVKQHFEGEAQEFDRTIVSLVPEYLSMKEALVATIPFDSAAPLRVIDLGCGTGTVAQTVLARIIHEYSGILPKPAKMRVRRHCRWKPV